jgi:hypothetical protein
MKLIVLYQFLALPSNLHEQPENYEQPQTRGHMLSELRLEPEKSHA